MDGRPIMVGVFRSIGCKSFPARFYPFMAAMEIEAEPNECGRSYDLELKLVDEDGREFYAQTYTLSLEPRPSMQPTYVYETVRIDPRFQLEGPGSFRIDLFCEGEIIGQSRLEVVADQS